VLSGSSGADLPPSAAQLAPNPSTSEPGEDGVAPNMSAEHKVTSEGEDGMGETEEEGAVAASTPISDEAMHRQRCKHRCEHHFTPQTYLEQLRNPCRCESENTVKTIRRLRALAFAPVTFHAFLACAIDRLPVNSQGFKTIYREIPEKYESKEW